LSKMSRNVPLLVCACMSAWRAPPAQTMNGNMAAGHSKEQLRMVVILSRHGVRSPTWTQARLDTYSALPWPKWSVPPGDLTSRGYELIRRFGSFDRASFAAAGLLAPNGCEDASKVYVWADSEQRTLASGKALAEGLFPAARLKCTPSLPA